MKKALLQSLVVASCVALVSSAAFAKKSGEGYGSYKRTADWNDVAGMDNPNSPNSPLYAGGLHASAAATTLVLKASKFDSGANCITDGWTTADVTQQVKDYWHVDDFAASNALGTIPAGTQSNGGITLNPVQGTKSMWMAQRIPPAGPVDTDHCGYLALPGYGNGWNQAFCTKACLAPDAGGPTTGLDYAFKVKYDSEPSYDGFVLEFTNDCGGNVGWAEIDGGPTVAGYSASDSLTLKSDPGTGFDTGDNTQPAKMRIHFTADTAWSNQDGLYPGFGVAIDSLTWEGTAVETFEGAAIGAHSVTDWESCNTPGYGNYLALFKKAQANYEDPCLDNLSCYWAAISGSTEFYSCGTPSQPTQKIVPHKNVRNEYLTNEVWSPTIALSGSGSDFRLRYTVYRDLPLENLIFHVWHVRTTDNTGCPSAWADRNFVYYGENKDWIIQDNLIGSKVNVATGVSIQCAIGVIDMCPFWCGVYGDGLCHSPAPYIDQVKIIRIGTVGPQWDVRSLETFQDNFAADGTVTGTARFDEANDIRPSSSPSISPGDSGIVQFLVDPKYVSGTGTNACGLLNDPNISTYPLGRASHTTKKQVYMWVAVQPFDATDDPGDKVGADLCEGGGTSSDRYYFSGTQLVNGILWTKVRMDYTYSGTATNPGTGINDPLVASRFNVDLNDNVFEPGDTILYFYSATSADATTYYSDSWGTSSDINEMTANPMEVTILPAGGVARGGDVLYVDGIDGSGTQNYWDGAFQIMSLNDKVDRYDVRGPTSGVSNRLAGRVVDIQQQLNDNYQKIIWDNGNSPITLGDGSGTPEKTDDYALVNTFLNNLTNPGGVMILGERAGEALDGYGSASAVTFKSVYMPFTLINANHRLAPTLFPISPKVYAWPGRAYSDNFNLFGGCPALNDFDVLGASGTSLVQMSYQAASSANGAVLSNVNGNANVLLAGFSLAYVRDDELDGVSDRAQFVHDSLVFMANNPPQPTGAGPALKNELSQNYPNPFNPQTTIAFTIKDRGAVSLKVYNVNGELVRTLINESRAAGSYSKEWDGRNNAGQPVSSGVYFYKLVTNNFSQTKKMVLLK